MSVSKKLISRLKTYTYNIDKKDMKHNLMSYKSGSLLAKRNRNIAIATISIIAIGLIFGKMSSGKHEKDKDEKQLESVIENTENEDSETENE